MSSDFPRRICFVTGTRAEFGLMRSTLSAIRAHPSLELQIIATGMHLSKSHGNTLNEIRNDGWTVDATVPWKSGAGESGNAIATGRAMAGMAAAIARLKTDIVLVVGDRVEAFAAAAAGLVAGVIVAHVHGGDRALGQVDDSLRHAITKLAHLHFPATAEGADRILKLGEDRWRIHRGGSPGVDGIAKIAASVQMKKMPRRSALLVLHPTGTDPEVEYARARLVLNCVQRIGFKTITIIYPNNDPGSAGIIRCWEEIEPSERVIIARSAPRALFLRLMRDSAVLVGNSSSGIIEAASFGTPVVDIGPRQQGRERSGNVVCVRFSRSRIISELRRIWNDGNPLRYPKRNVYGGSGAGQRIATTLAGTKIDDRLSRKLIAY